MNHSGKTQAHVGVIAESDAISPFSLVGVKVEEEEDELYRHNCSSFPFARSVRSDQSVVKWNARVFRTGSGQSGPVHGSGPLSHSGRPKRGNLESVAGKLYARTLDLSI